VLPGDAAVLQRWPDRPAVVYEATGRRTDAYAHLRELPRPICFSPDGKWVVCAPPAAPLEVRDARTGARVRALTGPSATYAWIAGNRVLATGPGPDEFRLWDLPTGKDLGTLQAGEPYAGSWDACISGDGGTVALATGKQVYVWRLDRLAPKAP
jgi:WD40 repeat protein